MKHHARYDVAHVIRMLRSFPITCRGIFAFTVATIVMAAGCVDSDPDAHAAQLPARAGSRQPGTYQGTARSVDCTVTRVADGDSMTCGSAGRVRLLSIDSPELSQGTIGRNARNVLLRLMPIGTRVRIETDIRERDQYDRILGYIYLTDGRMINEEMAKSGYATALVYPPNVRHAELIRAAVDEARRAKRGLWATPSFDCAPRDHRARKC